MIPPGSHLLNVNIVGIMFKMTEASKDLKVYCI